MKIEKGIIDFIIKCLDRAEVDNVVKWVIQDNLNSIEYNPEEYE